ncbi:MAG TPA: polysaccharide biosynthesis/export family protein, partial [Acidobacteriaceae bacterium]|nr:polysaccharide biosynthesis/export family protein [Acidobacteriaceae bacterium]
MVRIRRQAGVVVLAALVAGNVVLRAQSTAGAGSTVTQSSENGAGINAGENARTREDALGRDQGPGSGATASAGLALTARQIFAVLDEKPEVVIELKTQLAEQLQQQGVAIDPNAVTDEMLYNAIATDPMVREKTTLFLRARGYVSGAGLTQTGDGIPVVAGMGQFSDFGEVPDTPPALLGSNPGVANLQSATSPGGWSGSAAAVDTNRSPASGTKTKAAVGGTRERNITDPPEVLREPTPYNLQSLRDLYTQIPDSSQTLRRFGSDVFVRRSAGTASRLGGSTSVPSLDVPIGPDYVLGPGDSLRIDLWGGLSQSFTRVVDRSGRLMLPEAGEVQVAGLTLERAQNTI